AGLAPLFAVLVDSHCVGAKKPDPAIFRVALESLHATPETTVFVGDSLRRDREGARRTGMRFIWMTPQGIRAAEAQACAEPPVEHAVADLRDLITILTCTRYHLVRSSREAPSPQDTGPGCGPTGIASANRWCRSPAVPSLT